MCRNAFMMTLESRAAAGHDAGGGVRSRSMSRQIALVLAGAAVLTGCTTIPQRELAAYRKAFDEARTQSENVLAEYIATRQAQSNLQAQVEARARANQPGAGSLPVRLGLQFSIPKIREERPGEDEVSVRIQAWEIAASYNETLADLAAGRSSREVGSAAAGLLESLQRFPIKEVAAAAGEAVPYAGAIQPLLEILEREFEARRFRRGVLEAAPLMEKFFGLLYADAENYWKARAGLLTGQFAKEEVRLTQLARKFDRIATSQAWSAESGVLSLVRQVNDLRGRFPGGPPFAEMKAAEANGEDAAEKAVELRLLADQISEHTEAAIGEATELRAYRDLMASYARLLFELESRMNELRFTVEAKRRRLPSLDELQQVISSARLAYTVYLQTR